MGRRVFVHEQHSVFGKYAVAGLDQLPSELRIFRVILVVCRYTALDREQIFSADLAHVTDIPNQRVTIEIETQIDKVGQRVKALQLHGFIELVFLIPEKAVHALGKVIDLIQIYESVLQKVEFLGEYDLDYIQLCGADDGIGAYLRDRVLHGLFRTGKGEFGLIIGIPNFQLDHVSPP